MADENTEHDDDTEDDGAAQEAPQGQDSDGADHTVNSENDEGGGILSTIRKLLRR